MDCDVERSAGGIDEMRDEERKIIWSQVYNVNVRPELWRTAGYVPPSAAHLRQAQGCYLGQLFEGNSTVVSRSALSVWYVGCSRIYGEKEDHNQYLHG